MTIKDIRELLAKDLPTIGTWLQLPSPDAAEIMARCGYDWACVDMEHGSFGIGLLPDMFRAIECGGAVPFARLPEASRTWIKAALEAGAQGLVFPMIESGAQLARAISLSTYPGQDCWRNPADPLPEYRGVGFCRANGFGKDFESYFGETSSSIFIVAQIESLKAVENLDDILACRRLDAIMVGPYDLSGSMGMTGQFEAPEFVSVMQKIATACKKYGCRMGLHIVKPDQQALKREIAAGARFIAYGIDTFFLWHSAQMPDLRR